MEPDQILRWIIRHKEVVITAAFVLFGIIGPLIRGIAEAQKRKREVEERRGRGEILVEREAEPEPEDEEEEPSPRVQPVRRFRVPHPPTASPASSFAAPAPAPAPAPEPGATQALQDAVKAAEGEAAFPIEIEIDAEETDWRRAIVLREVLETPVALRH